MTIEINPGFRRALDIMEGTSHHVFITGKAGTGKSTLLELWRGQTLKRIAVLAPTGVAALNVRGQTIHSFFGFKPDVTPEAVRKLSKGRGAAADRAALYRNLDAIVIDEVSMVRADLMDCVEKFLRLNGPRPKEWFGGLQMIFIGDLYQLPPVVTGQERGLFAPDPPSLRRGFGPRSDPASVLSAARYESPYFFSARIFAEPDFDMDFVELEKVYRQSDAAFIALLNAIRNRSVDDGADRPPQQPPRPLLHAARRRVLHHAHQHERPGRRPQPREALGPARPGPPLRGLRSTASSTAAPSRPTRPSSSSPGPRSCS